MSKEIIPDIIDLVATRELDLFSATTMIEKYMHDRLSAHITYRRDDEGKKAKLQALELEKKIRPVLSVLKNLDSMTYYPMTIDGVTYTMADRVKLLKYLKEKLDE